MKIMKKILKTPVWFLTLCMAVVVVFSLLANVVNTSGWQVNVKNVNFDTKSDAITGGYVGKEYEGNMEGLLYTPKGCDAKNPCPVIVTTHGYLNSKEMQDAPAIELSRRGFIVLALDQYDHGESTWNTPASFAFYVTSVYDAAKWVYEQDWALKDAAGNGMIAVSGHSMGGFSTEMAVLFDETMYAFTGVRKIAVSLSVGADYRYTSFYGGGDDKFIAKFGPRSSGMIIGHFDEFFGDDGKLGGNTVGYKNYIETNQAKKFLGDVTKTYKDGKFYDHAAGGQRVVFTPNETHPWNHFSTETTAFMVDFYTEAFDFQLNKAGIANDFASEKGGQTWWLKEAFECIAMIGLLAAIVPAFALLLKVPFFAKVKTAEEDLPVEKETTKGKKVGLVLVALLTSLIPAYYFPKLISGKASNLTMFFTLAETIISISILVAISAWIIYFAYRMTKGDENKEEAKKTAWGITKAALCISFAALFLRFFAQKGGSLIPTNWYYNGPTASQIGFWAVISAAISFVVLTIVHFIARKRDGATIKSYGLAANIKQVLLALLIAIILFVGVYVIVFLVGWALNTDFRLWVYAIKSFEWHHFVSFLRYVPVYFVFYFINSIVVAANTKDVKGWKGYLYAIGLNAGGLVLFLAYQYGKLFVTGTAYVPSLALEGILLFGLVPSLAIAAIFAKKFYEKTNNIWTSAFFNTFLFTMIAIANTAIYLLAK
jgi:hypothetical protein